MRHYHRWLSFPLVILLFLVTATGLYLQVAELIEASGPERPRPTRSSLPDPDRLAADLRIALARAAAAKPGFPAQKIELSYAGGKAVARLATSARIGPSIEVDLQTGATRHEARPQRSLRTLFMLWHSGKYFGAPGLVAILAAGLILMILTVTGLTVYLQMYRRRRQLGRTGLFWR